MQARPFLCKCRSSLPCPVLVQRGERAAVATLFLPSDPTHSAPRVQRTVAARGGRTRCGEGKTESGGGGGAARRKELCSMVKTALPCSMLHTPPAGIPCLCRDSRTSRVPRACAPAVGVPETAVTQPVRRSWLEPRRLVRQRTSWGELKTFTCPSASCPAGGFGVAGGLRRVRLPETPHRRVCLKGRRSPS